MGRGAGNYNAHRSKSTQPQVFADPSQRRTIQIGRGFAILAISLCVWGFVFLSEIVSPATLKHTFSDWRSRPDAKPAEPTVMPWLEETRRADSAMGDGDAGACPGGSAAVGGLRIHGILPSAPDWTYHSLKATCGQLGVLMPEAYEIDAATRTFRRKSIDIEAQDAVDRFLENAPRKLPLFPTITLGRNVNGAGLAGHFAQPEFRAEIVEQIARTAESGLDGMCLDAGGWPDAEMPILLGLLTDLRAALSEAGRETCLIVGAKQAHWKSALVIDSVDRLVLRLYDQPWIGSPPAPLADADWFRNTAQEALRRVGPDKLVAALGTASVDWVSGRPMPETIPYGEAMTRISEAGVQVRFSKRSGNAFAAMVDDDGNRHEIWMLDAVTAHNQLSVLRSLGVTDVAITSLGFEDPSLWRVLGGAGNSIADLEDRLRKIEIHNYVHYTGEGPFLRSVSRPVTGQRSVRVDELTGLVTAQSYQRIPAATTIERFGRAAPNQIVLTFDDGPHPEYTPPILDALRDAGVPATFFVVGNNALRAPDLASRIVGEGHEIGSHTFMHPRMDQVSYYRSVVEVNSVQKLISGTTGRGMRLYREPFMRAEGPMTARQAEPLRLLNDAGYIVAGSDIVPPDWEDITARDIVDHVIDKVEAGRGNVIVLHDAGSDRTRTVEAVPILISALQARGYEFVTMAEVLGTSRDALMPVTAGANATLESVSFSSMAALWKLLIGIFWLAIVIGVLRSLGVLALALSRRRHVPADRRYKPSVTVVIPAFNEELVIVKSIRKVLGAGYPGLKVIVVDDGSTDRTKARVLEAYGRDDRVRLVAQPNQGKWRALNAAYSLLDSEIAVCIDADTQITRDAIARMARHFADPEIGAVAGKVVVGNRRNLLTCLQALEYVTAQAIDRRAGERINGMLVVPGAIGAWRVEAVRAAGLYSNATLSEDADLTVAVNRAGYRTIYEETAVAFTEAPATLRGLLAQRLRWSLGMFQTGWKHRRALREGRTVGCVTLPDLAIFGYLFPLLAPVADALFLYLLYDYLQATFSTDLRVTAEPPAYLLLGYLLLPVLELAVSATAIAIDRTERFRLLLLFPFQRFFYRQILYFTVIRAMLRALTGRLAAWNKADRVGFVARRGLF